MKIKNYLKNEKYITKIRKKMKIALDFISYSGYIILKGEIL